MIFYNHRRFFAWHHTAKGLFVLIYMGMFSGLGIPQTVDPDCKASIDFFVCNNPTWVSCNYGKAHGHCTNPRLHNESCSVHVRYTESNPSFSGDIRCPSCDRPGELPDANWNCGDTLGCVIPEWINDKCIESVRDGTCSIPHFKYEGLLWNVCVKGVGCGTCTNTFFDEPLPCDIQISTNCTTGAKSCGHIACIGNQYSCDAYWNFPDKPEFYDYPDGCMSAPKPNPNSDSTENNKLILPLSITVSVLFTGIASVLTTAAICFCYSRYKRQGYHTVQ